MAGKWWQSGLASAISLGTVKVLLTNNTYTYSRDHDFRSDITGELAASGNYVSGGFVCAATVTVDDTNDRIRITFPQVDIANASFTAYNAVYYRSRGGAASADEIYAVNQFDNAPVTATGATFTIPAFTFDLNNAS